MITNSLKVERVRKNLTQAELARQIGVSRQTIHAIEKNKYIPSTELALKLSAFLGISVNELFRLQAELQSKVA
ncbi:MAG: helix-turn-helix transcriptional regulator [Chitinophagales bacterium]|nr:helix-turn-helix transcriptional regulator [Chitinophagales bacterium]